MSRGKAWRSTMPKREIFSPPLSVSSLNLVLQFDLKADLANSVLAITTSGTRSLHGPRNEVRHIVLG
jgi:hypothetical protein